MAFNIASHFSNVPYRGSYMSAYVLLNFLNELGKRDIMRGLPCFLSLFCNEFCNLNKAGAQTLESIKLLKITFFA